LNRELDHKNIPAAWLPEQLCVRFGFCGEEYDSILREVKTAGQQLFSDTRLRKPLPHLQFSLSALA
jgi:hypothetical protein